MWPTGKSGLRCLAPASQFGLLVQDQSGAEDFAGGPPIPVLVPSVSTDEDDSTPEILSAPGNLSPGRRVDERP
ncbi:MAG: hypothetical protein K0U78_17460 [Actinomycetia bacterium]|nr:hypothetical protein [Actinomycetes bacterium]